MSATNSITLKGQSSRISPVAATLALAAVVIVGSMAVATSLGVGGSSTTIHPRAGRTVVTDKTMSGPRTAAQKGLGVSPDSSYSGSDFAGQYRQWLAAQSALVIAGPNSAYSGSDFAGQYRQWLAAQPAAQPVYSAGPTGQHRSPR